MNKWIFPIIMTAVYDLIISIPIMIIYHLIFGGNIYAYIIIPVIVLIALVILTVVIITRPE